MNYLYSVYAWSNHLGKNVMMKMFAEKEEAQQYADRLSVKFPDRMVTVHYYDKEVYRAGGNSG